jgi:hypothetical protein
VADGDLLLAQAAVAAILVRAGVGPAVDTKRPGDQRARVAADVNDMGEQLITPVLDLSAATTVTPEFDHYLNVYAAATGDVGVHESWTQWGPAPSGLATRHTEADRTPGPR